MSYQRSVNPLRPITGTTGIRKSRVKALPAVRPGPMKMMPGASVTISQPWRGATAFSGMPSRPPGARVARAMSGMGDAGAPRWYTALYGASLGDDDAVTAQAATITDGPAMWQQSLLDEVQQLNTSLQTYTTKDMWARYAQIAATLAIPLSAAVWRMIFRSGRGDGG